MRKYGWPLVLFVGIPFVATIISAPTTYFYDRYGDPHSYELSLWIPGMSGFTSAVLLGVLYLRVRKAEQSMLRLVWSYKLVINSISALLYFGAVFAGYGDSLQQFIKVLPLITLPLFLPMLWFARRASRASLTHAFFLVFIGGLTLPGLPESLPFYVGWLWNLAESILAAWLLANFDVRGLRFRRSAAALVVGLDGLAYVRTLFLPIFLFLLPGVIFLLHFPLQLVLIYLVRVRRPAAEAGLLLGTPPGDER